MSTLLLTVRGHSTGQTQDLFVHEFKASCTYLFMLFFLTISRVLD